MEYSPILSIVTAVFEIAAALWALTAKCKKAILLLSSALLFFLAGYQILEVIICANPQQHLFLSRFAFLWIALLPPVGLLLTGQFDPLRTKAVRLYSVLMFAVALAAGVWIMMDRAFVTRTVCSVVFARFSNPAPEYLLYCIFYDSGLLGIVLLSWYGIVKGKDPVQRRMLKQILLGMLFFIIPSLITLPFLPENGGALPSVMCHYALLLAIFITRLIWLERRQMSA
jgi:hypothetical protein